MDRPCSLLCRSHGLSDLALLRRLWGQGSLWPLHVELLYVVDSPKSQAHWKTSKQMNKFSGLKFLYRNPAHVLWSVCGEGRYEQEWEWGGNDLCLPWLHYAGTPPPTPAFGQPSSKQPAYWMRGCRRGSWGLHHQRKNSSVWLERRQCMKNGGKGSGGEGK